MNPATDSLFAGIAGVDSEIEEFEIGHGVMLRRTYAHFMAPFLMASSPAKPGAAHPTPWSAVKGGLGFDISLELHVPATFKLPSFFDRLQYNLVDHSTDTFARGMGCSSSDRCGPSFCGRRESPSLR